LTGTAIIDTPLISGNWILMEAIGRAPNWSSWQKMLFRFFFISLSLLSIIAYNPVMQVLNTGYIEASEFFRPLAAPAAWLDSHIFDLGYLPEKHSIDFSDTRFSVIVTFSIFGFALIATSVWTVLAKHHTNYNRLYYWFSNYLAFYVFLAMAKYAIFKIIPIQATYPTAPELLMRWGDLRNWEVLFRFMGTSPAYCMFCGWLELIASILILFSSTRVIGGLLMIIALIQVVLLNIFYNNNIILLSGILLLCTIFIIARSFPKLYTVFIKLKPVSLAEYRYTFGTPWKKYSLLLFLLLPAWKIFISVSEGRNYYGRYMNNRQRQKLYNVSIYQQENDTIPPLTTDTTRWKYICFLDYSPTNKQLVKFGMDEKTVNYRCMWDSVNHTITVIDRRDTSNKNVFLFSVLPNNDMLLEGSWFGKYTSMQLTNMPIDSFMLVKDKFSFLQDE
jgi:hypothetical protein